MARIADEEIERLKKEVALEALVAASGVELQKAGADLVGRCPFHDDREPSLVVSPAKNLWHCLGACQAGGSVIDWVMRSEGVSFRHAVELLASRTGRPARCPAPPRPAPPSGACSSPVERDAGDAEALAQVVEYYHVDPARFPRGARLPAFPARRRPRGHRSFPPRPRRPHPVLPPAHQGAQGGRRAEGTAAAPRGVPSLRPRALQRLRGRPDIRQHRRRRRDLRPQARLGPPHRPARPPLPARPAPGRVELTKASPAARSSCASRSSTPSASGAPATATSPPPTARPASPTTTGPPSLTTRCSRCLIAYDHDDAGDAAADKLAAELMATRHRVPAGGVPLGR